MAKVLTPIPGWARDPYSEKLRRDQGFRDQGYDAVSNPADRGDQGLRPFTPDEMKDSSLYGDSGVMDMQTGQWWSKRKKPKMQVTPGM